jgi:uncharacterized cupredoxin-like copper-binding protein
VRIAIALIAALVLGACAQDTPTVTQPEQQPEPAGPQTVAITAVEYEFQGIPETLEAGETTFTMENAGEEQHELQLTLITGDQSVEELIELPGPQVEEFIQPVDRAFARPGGTDEFTADLEPGRYGYVCFIQAKDGTEHAALGMYGEFEVA